MDHKLCAQQRTRWLPARRRQSKWHRTSCDRVVGPGRLGFRSPSYFSISNAVEVEREDGAVSLHRVGYRLTWCVYFFIAGVVCALAFDKSLWVGAYLYKAVVECVLDEKVDRLLLLCSRGQWCWRLMNYCTAVNS